MPQILGPPFVSSRLSIDCPVIAETPRDRAHFFGFHDVTPWNPANDMLAVLRVDPEIRHQPDGEVAEICLWKPGAGAPEPVGSTTAWNFQMGARAQWLADGRLIYNKLAEGRLGACVFNPADGTERMIGYAVCSVHPGGRVAIAPNYGRLRKHWPAYGLPSDFPASIDTPAPEDDGIWRVDLETGVAELLIPIAEIAQVGAGTPADVAQVVTHTQFNPGGTQFAFMHRYFLNDGAIYSRLLVANGDGSNLRLLAEEKVTHYDWRDDGTILAWSRFMSSGLAAARRSGLLGSPILRPAISIARKLRHRLPSGVGSVGNEHYFLIPVDAPTERRVIGADVLPVDGHPMFHVDDPGLMVTDTYPDAEGMQNLMLFDLDGDRRIDIGRYLSDLSVGDGDMKCDLHPRWDRTGRKVSVDSSRAGIRQNLIVDVAPALDARAGGYAG